MRAILGLVVAVFCAVLGVPTWAGQWDQGEASLQRLEGRMPPNYYFAPHGRTGKTVGVAFIPLGADKTKDSAVRGIPLLVNEMPAIDYVVPHPAKEPFYIFKFLQRLRQQGKQVDVLMVAGHQEINDWNGLQGVHGIVLSGSNFMNDKGQVFDVNEAIKRINEANARGDLKSAKGDCEALQLIADGRKALAPGAEIIYHSCYGGHPLGRDRLRAIGKLLLGNGGSIVGPEQPIGTWIMPDGSLSAQLIQSLHQGRFVYPGDAVVGTDSEHSRLTFARLQIPAQNLPAIPACCNQQKPVPGDNIVGLWERTDGHQVRFAGQGDKISGTIVRLTPVLDNVGFRNGEETFKLERAAPNNFSGQILWKWGAGRSTSRSEWRPVTLTLSGRTMTDSSGCGNWKKIGN